jgi:Flp pilus assembly protein TadB
MVVALVFHAVKTLARPILNSMSFGAAAPVVSLVEDVASFLTSMVAILLPLLILVVFPLMVLGGVWVVRRRRRRRARKAGRDGAPA